MKQTSGPSADAGAAPGALGLAAQAACRLWWAPGVAAVMCAALAGGIDALRAPVYESHAMIALHWEAEIQRLRAILTAPATPAAGTDAASDAHMRRALDEAADRLVAMMGNRILDKDQTLEQYVTSYQFNALDRIAGSDEVLRRLMARGGNLIEQSWPGAASDYGILRREAIRVSRSKPESFVTIAFRARDADTARAAVTDLIQILEEIEREERLSWNRRISPGGGMADASSGGSASARAPLDAPAFTVLQAPAGAVRVCPLPLRAAARGAIAGFLLALLFVAACGEGRRRLPDQDG